MKGLGTITLAVVLVLCTSPQAILMSMYMCVYCALYMYMSCVHMLYMLMYVHVHMFSFSVLKGLMMPVSITGF